MGKKITIILFLSFVNVYGATNWLNTSDTDFNGGTPDGVSIRGTGASSYIELVNDWTEKTPSPSPSNRCYSYISYNSAADGIILFGGLGASALQDTWEYSFSSNTWTNKNASNPPSARYKGIMVYYSVQQVMVLFGGWDGSVKGETWVYDYGSNGWTPKSPSGPPSARFCHGMAYDVLNERVILFGGTSDGANGNNETWVYNVAAGAEGEWTQKIPVTGSPSARFNHSMCYAGNGKVILFGGFDGSVYKNDTWIYDFVENTWTQKFPLTSPSIRGYHSLSYDSINEKVIMFGGWNISTYFNETWVYDVAGNNWKNMAPPVLPSGRYRLNMAYDNTNQKTIIFGGNNGVSDLPDTWAYNLRLNNSNTNTWISSSKDTGTSTTTLSWMNISWNPSSQPADTELKFRIATNNDNSTWNYLGFDGTGTTYYTNAGGQVINPVHNGNRYFKLNAYLNSTKLSTPTLSDVTVSYNRPPTTPTLVSPNNGVVTTTTPIFTWNNSADDDGDTRTYKLYLDAVTPPVTAYTNIAEGTSTTSFTITSPLTYGVWYWKVQCFDGNAYSTASTICSIDADTPPSVTISSPNTGDWSGSSQSVVWTFSDPDGPGYQISSFDIKLSRDSGSTYPITIASGVSVGTSPQTISSIDTRQYANSGFCKIKVIATDGKGLTGEDVADGLVTINNPNIAPIVTLTSFDSGGVFSGVQNITWTCSDQNGTDTHTFDIKLSSDGGLDGYPTIIVSGLTSSPYAWPTGNHPNGTQYKIKVIGTDNGVPSYSGEDTSSQNITINNANKPPNTFSLLTPVNGSTLSDDTPTLTWENNGDPDSGLGDYVAFYKLHYSTNSNFLLETVISGITSTSYTLPKLTDLTTYYFKIEALDTQSVSRYSNEVFSFKIDRKNVSSSDNLITVNITSGLPDNGYLKVIQSPATNAISNANLSAKKDPLIKPIGDSTGYSVDFFDAADSKVSDVVFSATILFTYSDADNNGVLDGTSIPVKYLRIFKLNEVSNKWEIVESGYSLDTTTKVIRAIINSSGIYNILGYVIPETTLSNVTNYPNPFSAGKEETKIVYVLTKDSDVEISIYTLTGDLVRKFNYSAGAEGGKGTSSGYTNEISWDGKNGQGSIVANGIYNCEIIAGKLKEIRRIGVLK
ncbi:MAG: kelch repeat-containing protein [Candidatus Firestonebacteria bacterium]